MNTAIIAAVYAAILWIDFRTRRGQMTLKDKVMYCILGILALAGSFPAGKVIEADTVGSSLSGMISLFMR